MLKDKSIILKINFQKEKPYLLNIINHFFESLYALYDFILEDPIEIFWYECLSIIISYLQLIAFIFDKTVSII